MGANSVMREIRRSTQRRFSPEEKIRIVVDGLRSEVSVSELCRREGIALAVYYRCLQAGKNGLTRDTRRDAAAEEVKRLKQENEDLKKALAEAILNAQKYKKSLGM
jgi:transposase